MIADRPYLASQIKNLNRMLSELDDWTDNPAKPFPSDAVALADQLQWLAILLRADGDMPEGPAE